MKDESFGIIPFTKEGFKYKFLLVQRTADGENGGHWSFPKGHKEEGESDKDAALREFKEETGLQDIIILDDKDFVEQYFFKKGNDMVYKTVKYFLGFMGSPGEIKIQTEEIRQ